jgi:hypothetical protein
MTLMNKDGKTVAGGEDFDGWAGAGDAWGADEDHLKRIAFERCRRIEDCGVDLAAVGVALDRYVECSERFLGGVFDVSGEQDRSGAGAEGRGGLDKGSQDVEEVVALEEFEHCGGFTTGHDEAVDSFEIPWQANKFRCRAQRLDGAGVGFVCALEGEDAYGAGLNERHRTDTLRVGRQREAVCRTGCMVWECLFLV